MTTVPFVSKETFAIDAAYCAKRAYMFDTEIYCWICLPQSVLDDRVIELSSHLDRRCGKCGKTIPKIPAAERIGGVAKTDVKKEEEKKTEDTEEEIPYCYWYGGNRYHFHCLPDDCTVFTTIQSYVDFLCHKCGKIIKSSPPVKTEDGWHRSEDGWHRSGDSWGSHGHHNDAPYVYVPPVDKDLLFIKRLASYDKEPESLKEQERLELFCAIIADNIHVELGGKYLDEAARLVEARIIDESGNLIPEANRAAFGPPAKPEVPLLASGETLDADLVAIEKILAENLDIDTENDTDIVSNLDINYEDYCDGFTGEF